MIHEDAPSGLWPEGRRVAVCLTWDFDDETPFYYRSGVGPIKVLSELEQRAFGLRRAIVLIRRMLDEAGLPAAFYIPSYLVRRSPELPQSLDQAGYEIGCHGYLHELLADIPTRADEAELLDRSLAILEDVLGHKVTGYRSPSWELNRWSLDLLKERGLLYDSSLMGDIYPYEVPTDHGPMLEVPINWNLDDVEHWGHTFSTRQKPIAPPSAVLDLWTQEFEGIRAEGGVFVLTLHPHVSGRPGLLRTVRSLIDHIQACGDVWWTTPAGVAEHLGSSPAHPLRHELPADRPIRFDD